MPVLIFDGIAFLRLFSLFFLCVESLGVE